jgi:hypothetical protein
MMVEPWRSPARTTALLRACAFGFLAVFLDGCGGGSGGNPTVASQGNPAFRAASIATDQALTGGVVYLFAMLKATAPKSSTVSRAAATHLSARAGGTRAGALTLNPQLNLYALDPVVTSNSMVISYFKDAGGTQDAGSVTYTKPGLTDFNPIGDYPKYPVTATGRFNVTAGNLPVQGNITILYSSGTTGANTMTGHLNLTRTGIGIDLNLALSDTQNVTGSAILKANGQTISVTGINGPITSRITCAVNIDPQGWTGTGNFSLQDGTFAMTVNPGGGTDTAQTDTTGNITVAYADGQSEVIYQPLAAGLLGAIGSNPNGSGAGGNTNSFFNTPIAIGGKITAINANGQMVGDQGYYAGPSATPQTLKALAGGTAAPTGINAAGQIVGYNVVSSGDPTAEAPLYWATPTSQPAVLQTLAAGAVTRAWAINSQGQMVGMSAVSIPGGSYSVTPIYWADPTSAPRALPMTPFTYAPAGDSLSNPYDPTRSFYIADNGVILVASGTGNFSGSSVFTAPASASDPIGGPTRLRAINDVFGTNVQGSAMSTNGIIAGINSGLTPVIWPSPTALPQALGVPATYQAYYGYVNSVNKNSVVVGSLSASFLEPFLWKDGQTLNINTLLPTGAGITVKSAYLINDANTVVVTGTKTGSFTSQYFVLVAH